MMGKFATDSALVFCHSPGELRVVDPCTWAHSELAPRQHVGRGESEREEAG